MTNDSSGRLNFLMKVTNIFEKEGILFVYYCLFGVLSLEGAWLNTQLVFFMFGLLFQVYCKIKNIWSPWNNFLGLSFFLLGSFLNYENNVFFKGMLIFISVISFISFMYERWHSQVKQKLLSVFFNFIYSSIVLMSFPILYFIFMQNKLDINLVEFFQESDHALVFSGYFVFYLLLLLNKQLIAIQAVLLHKK